MCHVCVLVDREKHVTYIPYYNHIPSLCFTYTCTYSSANIKWSASLSPIEIKPFREASGPRTIIPRVIKAIFMLFFNCSLFEMIVDQTNKYADECVCVCVKSQLKSQGQLRPPTDTLIHTSVMQVDSKTTQSYTG